MSERRMIHLIDTTDNNLVQNTFCFDSNAQIDCEQLAVPSGMEDARFGVLTFVAQKVEETKCPLEFVFTIDNSASMREYCNWRRCKMDYIIHIIKKMITFMYEQTKTDFHIVIKSFNDNVEDIVTRTKITPENYSSIISKIETINPTGSTNIENALMKAQEEIEHIKTQFPTHKVHHILLTDGLATSGSTDISVLKKYIVCDVMNAFIGIGIDHDSLMLRSFSNVSNQCEYHFIDKLETAGLVCGEILHYILYKVLSNVEITVSNGLVYDFKTNEWVNKLKIPDIVSEAKKTYNIISNNTAHFTAGICGSVDKLIVYHQTQRSGLCDLTQHVFRQRTLQLMYLVNQYFCRRDEIESFCLQGKMVELITAMNMYIEEKNIDLNNDKFMKTLCDDIMMCIKNLDNSYGHIFCGARQTSQGTQRIYTVTDYENTRDLYRESSWHVARETNDLSYIMNSTNTIYDSPYLTSQSTLVMSYVNNSNDETTREY